MIVFELSVIQLLLIFYIIIPGLTGENLKQHNRGGQITARTIVVRISNFHEIFQNESVDLLENIQLSYKFV